MKRPFGRGTTPLRGLTTTMVTNHLLTGMILPPGVKVSCQTHTSRWEFPRNQFFVIRGWSNGKQKNTSQGRYLIPSRTRQNCSLPRTKGWALLVGPTFNTPWSTQRGCSGIRDYLRCAKQNIEQGNVGSMESLCTPKKGKFRKSSNQFFGTCRQWTNSWLENPYVLGQPFKSSIH